MLRFLPVLLLLFSACMTKDISAPRHSDRFHTEGLAELGSELSLKRSEVGTFRALAQAEIRYGESVNRLRYAFARSGEDNFRLEALPLTTVYTLSLLQLKDERVLYLDTGEKRAYWSSVGDGSLERLLRLPLGEQELMSYVNGRVPSSVLTSLRAGELLLFKQGGAKSEKYVLRNQDGSRYWVIDSQSKLLERFHLRDPLRDLALLDIVLSDFQSSSGTLLPGQIRAQVPVNDVELVLSFRIQKINLVLPPSLFRQTIPKGYGISSNSK